MLKAEQKALNEKKLQLMDNQYKNLEESMNELNNVIHVNFNGAYELGSLIYNELKENVHNARNKMLSTRKEILSLKSIYLLKVCAALLMAFIVIRVVSDNETLLESMTYITFFALYMDSFTGTFFDFVVQDFILIYACSYFIAKCFRESETMKSKEILMYGTIGILIGISGLIFSAFLYTI